MCPMRAVPPGWGTLVGRQVGAVTSSCSRGQAGSNIPIHALGIAIP